MSSDNSSKHLLPTQSEQDPLTFLLKYSNDLILLIDQNYKIITINEITAEYFKWHPTDVIGNNFIKQCVDDGIELCLPKDMNSIFSGHVANNETTMQHNEINITLFWTIEKIDYQSDGLNNALIIIGRNITSSNLCLNKIKPFAIKNNNGLGPIQHYLEQISQTLPGIIFWKDLNGVYHGCNQYFLDECKFHTMGQIVNHTDFDLWPKEAEMLQENDQRVIQEDITIRSEEHVTLPNGDTLYNTMIKSPLKNEDGQIVGLIGNGIRINEIKQFQHELQYRLESIIDAIPGSVYWKNKDLVYHGCNHFFLEVFGFKDKSEVIGKRDEELWGKQADLLQQHDQEVIENDTAICVEESITLPKTGQTLDLTVVKKPLKDTEGNVIGLVGNSLEITQLKKIQAQLVCAKKQAEEANVAKTAFLRNMRHDLRTPFSGILGLTQLLKEDETNPEKLEKLNDIVTSANSLLEMLSDIMEYTQIETSHNRLLLKKFSLKSLVYELSSTMTASIKEKGLQFNVNYDQDLPDVLIGDKFKVQRILVNLIGNAIKFTNTGSISFSVLFGEQKDNMIYTIFIIKDTGVGIPEEKFNFIFERFNKVSSSYTNSNRGIGLGLHAVKELVDELGGEIELESQVGHGSTFTCMLPLKKPLISDSVMSTVDKKLHAKQSVSMHNVSTRSTEKITPPIHDNQDAKALNILLVEDDRIATIVAQTLLIRQHHTVTSTHCGKDALKKLAENNFDLILLDLGLPDIQGQEVLRAIRNDLKLDTPVVVLTAHLDKVKSKSWEDLDANMFLLKPLTSEKLHSITDMMVPSESL